MRIRNKNICTYLLLSQAPLAGGPSCVLHEEQGPGGLDQPLGAPHAQVPGEEGQRQGGRQSAPVICLALGKSTKVLLAGKTRISGSQTI